jgi:hypothetical protein
MKVSRNGLLGSTGISTEKYRMGCPQQGREDAEQPKGIPYRAGRFGKLVLNLPKNIALIPLIPLIPFYVELPRIRETIESVAEDGFAVFSN